MSWVCFIFFLSSLLLLGTYVKLYYFPSGIQKILETRGGPKPFRDHLDALVCIPEQGISLREKLNSISRCNIILSLFFKLENRIAVLREYEYLKASVAFVHGLPELIWKHYCLCRAWRRYDVYLFPLCPLRKITIQQILLDCPEIELESEINSVFFFFYSYRTEFGSC